MAASEARGRQKFLMETVGGTCKGVSEIRVYPCERDES